MLVLIFVRRVRDVLGGKVRNWAIILDLAIIAHWLGGHVGVVEGPP